MSVEHGAGGGEVIGKAGVFLRSAVIAAVLPMDGAEREALLELRHAQEHGHTHRQKLQTHRPHGCRFRKTGRIDMRPQLIFITLV